jgi:hypothetical protein
MPFRVLSVVVLWSGMLACGQSTQVSAGSGRTTTDQFVVGASEVRVPKGVFLLIRKGHQIGAIRFATIEQGDTVGTGKAGYESYFQADGSGSFRSSNVRKRNGENNLKPLKVIGWLAFRTGQDKIRVGDWSFPSSSPGAVSMWPYRGSLKDYGYEFAPTSARNVGEIDTSDKRLKWFRFDLDSQVTLRVADLPK